MPSDPDKPASPSEADKPSDPADAVRQGEISRNTPEKQKGSLAVVIGGLIIFVAAIILVTVLA